MNASFERFAVLAFATLSICGCGGKTDDVASDSGSVGDSALDTRGADVATDPDGAGAPVVSGGAHFRLTPALGAEVGACLDPGTEVTIAGKGTDGRDVLLKDDVDGATVQCAYDGSKFAVTVQAPSGFAMQASGTFTGATSNDAKMLFVVGPTTYRSSAACQITFSKKDGGALLGRFTCAEVDWTADASKKCGVTALTADGFTPESYFQFTDCGHAP